MRCNLKPTVAGRLIPFIIDFPPFISGLWRECWRHDEYLTTRVEFGELLDQRCLKVKKHQNYFRLNSAIKFMCTVIGPEHLSAPPLRTHMYFSSLGYISWQWHLFRLISSISLKLSDDHTKYKVDIPLKRPRSESF